MTAKLRSLIALAWTVAIFGLCWTPRAMMPVSEDPQSWIRFPSLDKIVHFGLFAGFGLLWAWSGVRGRWVVALGLLAALASELGQETAWVNRDATWGDGVADGLGLLAGIMALGLARRLFGPARTPSAGTP